MSTYSSDFFDEFSHRYDDSQFPFSGRSEIFRRQMQEIERRIQPRVLDLGCGEGEFLRALSGRIPRVEAMGVDFSERALSVARAAAPGVEWVRANLDDSLPLNGQLFDVILSAYVLHHWEDADKAHFLSRLARCHLSPGGVILMGDIAFTSQQQADAVRSNHEDLWDDEEHYFCFDSLMPHLDAARLVAEFSVLSPCCGMLKIVG